MAVDFYDIFDMDDNLVNEGRWFTFAEGFKLKIAKLGNDKHVKKTSELFLKFDPDEKLSKEEDKKLSSQALIGTVLLDWEGFNEEFSEEKALEYLMHDEFYKAVAGQANNRSMYTKKAAEKLKKN